MAIAPQINEDLFGVKIFTVIFTVRDTENNADVTDAGIFDVINDGGSTVTNNETTSVTIQGSQSECNTAMANLIFVPNADYTTNVGVSYAQTDNDGAATPGSNPFNDFMLMTLRHSHNEFNIVSAESFVPNQVSVWDLGSITDERPDHIDPDIIYTLTMTLSDSNAGILNNWNDIGSGVFSFTGIKSVCNDLLEATTFVPETNYANSFTMTYSQNQDTDSVDQGNQPITISYL